MELQNLYRTASPEELSFYQDRLYPLQDEVLEIASIYEQNIYLTGGTALSRFYYEHRFSNVLAFFVRTCSKNTVRRKTTDLDFFTTTDDLRAIANDLAARLQQLNYTIEIERLDIYFGSISYLQKHYLSHGQFPIPHSQKALNSWFSSKLRCTLYFARFFVVRPPCNLKIEFVKEFNLIGNLTKTDRGIYINSLEDLGANKVSAFEDRAEIKDIIDLYFITQTIPL